MSKATQKLLLQINENWKLETDGTNNVQILQRVEINAKHHLAKAKEGSTRWIHRGWYGSLRTAIEPTLHKMAEAGQTASAEEDRNVQSLIEHYTNCTQQLLKAVAKLK